MSFDLLLLIPSPAEAKGILGDESRLPKGVEARLCGIGVAAAGIGAANALAARRPSRVLLLGVAGTFDPDLAPVGDVVAASETVIYGIGAGTGSEHRDLSRMGLAPTQDLEPGPLPLEPITQVERSGVFVSVAACSTSDSEAARARRAGPDGLIEDMETWSVALACHQARVPLHAVRAVSNRTGDRERSNWRLGAALDHLKTLLPSLVEELRSL